jgi:signal transduction histidine kinase
VHRRSLTWFGLGIAAFTIAEFLPRDDAGAWVGLGGALRLATLVFALGAAAAELRRARAAHARQIARTREDLRALAQNHELLLRSEEDRAHEAKTALAAIDHAARALRRPGVRRGELLDAIAMEVQLLRRMLAENADDGLFLVREAVAAPVAAAKASGMDVAISVPDRLAAAGGAERCAQVVQALLENARRHAPGSAVHVSAEMEDEEVVIRVDDSGPGLSADPAALMARGAKRAGSPGRGIGLHASAQALESVGGRLWAESRPQGGARFAYTLPADRSEPPR